jgi:hypothetical protein
MPDKRTLVTEPAVSQRDMFEWFCVGNCPDGRAKCGTFCVAPQVLLVLGQVLSHRWVKLAFLLPSGQFRRLTVFKFWYLLSGGSFAGVVLTVVLPVVSILGSFAENPIHHLPPGRDESPLFVMYFSCSELVILLLYSPWALSGELNPEQQVMDRSEPELCRETSPALSPSVPKPSDVYATGN